MTVDSDLYAEVPVIRARMPIPEDCIDDLLDALWGLDPPVGSFQNLETGECFIDCYAIDKGALEKTASAMRLAAIDSGVSEPAISFETLPREDWAESWKRFFHVVRVSPRVTVRPPWENYTPERTDEVVVTIEPGMSFGTGLHGTTQACLRFLEQIADSSSPATMPSLADFGCGSGILSIAASKLGFRDVIGVDYDKAAVRISAENASDNDISGITFEHCDVTADTLPRRDVVVANILAPILIAAAPRIAGSPSDSDNAALILSGILDTQYSLVRSTYEALGWREQSSIAIGEWTSGIFRR